MLATDLAAGLDPVVFAAQCGIQPDPWQAAVLRSMAPKALWCCSRQTGKTTLAALLAVWTALYRPRSLVLMVAPAERQSAELLRTATACYRTLGHAVPTAAESVLRLELGNGSRLLALPGKSDGTVRGFSAPALVIVDEASRVPDALMAGLRPMLATVPASRLLALSTPYGRRGWFFHEWDGGEGWERTAITAAECPRISTEFLAAERRALGNRLFQQEYCCSFEAAVDSAFDFAAIERAVSADVLPLWGELAVPTPLHLQRM